MCVFYETKADLLDTIVSYFEAGLSNNEYCLWAISEPVTMREAERALYRGIPDFAGHVARNQVEIVPGTEWYLKGGRFDMKRVVANWEERARHARAIGYDGLRLSGNAFWLNANNWKEFAAYEHEVDHSLAGREMLALCTYSLRAARAVVVLDVVHAHQFTLARRGGEWELLETPELKQARQEIARLNGALDILSKRFPGHDLLTVRERLVLAHIITGAPNKDVARKLDIGVRTVEFHRANIMRKLGAKNTVDLVNTVLDET